MSKTHPRRADPFGVGDPSSVAKSIDQLPANSRVVLLLRESFSTQRNNLPDQEHVLRRACKKRGHKVVTVHSRISSGWNTHELKEVANLAKKYKAYIVAETLDRVVRPKSYHSVKNPNAVPTKGDLMLVGRYLDGQFVYLLESPQASPGENRGRQTKRGMRCKKKMGGRPIKRHRAGYRKRRRDKCRDYVLRKSRKHGTKYIQRRVWQKWKIRISRMTVWRWVRE